MNNRFPHWICAGFLLVCSWDTKRVQAAAELRVILGLETSEPVRVQRLNLCNGSADAPNNNCFTNQIKRRTEHLTMKITGRATLDFEEEITADSSGLLYLLKVIWVWCTVALRFGFKWTVSSASLQSKYLLIELVVWWCSAVRFGVKKVK